MPNQFSRLTLAATVAAAALSIGIAASVTPTSAQAQAPAAAATPSASALKTPWGEPDLQGIWTDEFDTPLQRSPKYANQEFLHRAQRAELDKQRAAHYGDDPRAGARQPTDVGGAYNTLFLTIKHVGPRTSMIADPPDGRIPPMTAEAQRAAAPIGNFVSRCCRRPMPARTRIPHVPAENTIRQFHLDGRNCLPATIAATSRASID